MILFVIFILVLSVFEIYLMRKNKNKSNKDIAIYILLASIATGLGMFYISNPYRDSIVYNIFKLLGINY